MTTHVQRYKYRERRRWGTKSSSQLHLPTTMTLSEKIMFLQLETNRVPCQYSELGTCWESNHASSRTGVRYSWLEHNHERHTLARWVLIDQGLDMTNLEACHKCDNPRCINPDHLYGGTRQENMSEAFLKGRMYPTTNKNASSLPVGISYSFNKSHKKWKYTVRRMIKGTIKHYGWFDLQEDALTAHKEAYPELYGGVS